MDAMDLDAQGRVPAFWGLQILELGLDYRASMEAYKEIERCYAEPTRHYHTLSHIDAVLMTMIGLLDIWKAPAAFLAVILHDVIYDTHAHDNEERSAEYADGVLTNLGVPAEVREDVSRLILLTKIHEAPREDAPACALIDADLAILAADQDKYDAYAAAIRREYDWVPEADYRAGRAKVLQRFLARPRIYRAEAWQQQQEPRARANLARELASLEGSR